MNRNKEAAWSDGQGMPDLKSGGPGLKPVLFFIVLSSTPQSHL